MSERVRAALLGVALLALAAGILGFVLTNGTWDFSASEPMGRAYVSMWESLRQGRFDVAEDAIQVEAFYREGKVYTYFGPFPALLRGALAGFVDLEHGDGSRISTFAALLVAVAAYLAALLRVAQSLPRPGSASFPLALFALAFVAGSPLLVVADSGSIYHEAIAWGLAWSMVSIAAALWWLESDRRSIALPALASLAAGLALLSRVTFGVGPYLVVALLALRLARSLGARRVAYALAPALVCLTLALWVNYERWGNPWTFMDVRHHNGFVHRPERLEAFQRYGAIAPSRIPTALDYYLRPRASHFSATLPYLELQPTHPLGMGPQEDERAPGPTREDYDWIAPGLPLTLISPFLLLTALWGVTWLARPGQREGALLASLFVPGPLLILACPGLVPRYAAEALPLLGVLSLAALPAWVAFEQRRPRARLALRALALAIFAAGCWGAGSAVVLEKLGAWTTPRQDRLTMQSYLDLFRAGEVYAVRARVTTPIAWSFSTAVGPQEDEAEATLRPERPAQLWTLQLAFAVADGALRGWRGMRVELLRSERVIAERELELPVTDLPIFLATRTPEVDEVRLYFRRSFERENGTDSVVSPGEFPGLVMLVPTWK